MSWVLNEAVPISMTFAKLFVIHFCPFSFTHSVMFNHCCEKNLTLLLQNPSIVEHLKFKHVSHSEATYPSNSSKKNSKMHQSCPKWSRILYQRCLWSIWPRLATLVLARNISDGQKSLSKTAQFKCCLCLHVVHF